MPTVREDSAEQLARRLEERGRQEQVPRLEMAALYLALGNPSRALQWLERAAADRAHSVALAPVDPRLAPLRSSSRFQRLIAPVRRGDSAR
jgi:hypothetical protein